MRWPSPRTLTLTPSSPNSIVAHPQSPQPAPSATLLLCCPCSLCPPVSSAASAAACDCNCAKLAPSLHLLPRYIHYAKTRNAPKITDEASERIVMHYGELRSKAPHPHDTSAPHSRTSHSTTNYPRTTAPHSCLWHLVRRAAPLTVGSFHTRPLVSLTLTPLPAAMHI